MVATMLLLTIIKIANIVKIRAGIISESAHSL